MDDRSRPAAPRMGEASLSEPFTPFLSITRCFLAAYTAQSLVLSYLDCVRRWLHWSNHSKLNPRQASKQEI